MGNWHREIIETIGGIKVAGIYDINKERLDYGTECGIKAYDSLEELLEDKNIDIVLVSTPNDVHNPIAIQP